jgi:hypothetical protein
MSGLHIDSIEVLDVRSNYNTLLASPNVPFKVTTPLTKDKSTMDNRRKGFYGWFGLTQPIFDPDNRFVTSLYVPPLVLGVIRIVLATYMTACIIVEPILLKKGRRTRRDAIKFPAYFTNITFISLTWY